uniref:Glycoside hydrolase family 76 protein n=1 Tax=Moniliophthora roreri TaxID=221103 RepID=A0A0W0G1L0_MONRR
MMMLQVYAVFAFISIAYSQDLGVPLSWRKFSNDRPLEERISIAQNGINEILPQLDSSTAEFNGIGYWQSGNVFSAMANLDHITGTNTNQARVVNNLNTAFNLHANYDKFEVSHTDGPSTMMRCMWSGIIEIALITWYHDADRRWWATSAVYAHRAYGDNNLLAHAIATWNHVSQYVVTAAQASSGSTPVKNFGLAGTCDGVTMAGGVFWMINPSIRLYLTLSAYLAEITGDKKYQDAAILSANWIKNHNINSDNIVLDTVNGHDCSRSPADWLFTYNSGKYVEGLSVLASITGDAQWTSLYTNIANSAMKTNHWAGSNGIITEGASPSQNNDGVGFKAIFIRGLHEAFARSSNNDLKILIHSYIDYNALLDLAANGNSYSSAWAGPPQGFTTWGQLAALDVLVSAVDAN